MQTLYLDSPDGGQCALAVAKLTAYLGKSAAGTLECDVSHTTLVVVAVCVHVPIGTCVCVHICVRVRARACALRVRVHVRVRVRVHARVRVLCVHPHVSLASCDSPGPNLSPRTPFAGWDNNISLFKGPFANQFQLQGNRDTNQYVSVFARVWGGE